MIYTNRLIVEMMRVFKNILQGRYAAALFSAANKNGSLDAVEKVGSLDRGPNFLKCLASIFDQPFFSFVKCLCLLVRVSSLILLRT